MLLKLVVKLPKSCELPKVDMVIKSMASVLPGAWPPVNNARAPRPVLDPVHPPNDSVSSASTSTQPIVSPL